MPDNDYYKDREWLKYAEEADILNVELFNTTAKKWRESNSNIRDYATINELTVLSNLESHNAELIKGEKVKKKDLKY